MRLPVNPPVSPMLSKSAALPEGDGWHYEPKWDGFRTIAFRDGDEVVLGSRNEKPLDRYFPDVVEAVRKHLPARCVVDGEIVVAGASGLDFDALQQRIHPAESRVRKLAAETPASLVVFDLLAIDDDDVRAMPFADRRARLDAAMASARPPVHLTPCTTDPAKAREWFEQFEGAGLDGVVAKRLDGPYREGERVMVKVKHKRTADCVVAGFRWHKSGPVIGSLLLGLYDDDGVLHHVGVIGAFPMAQRKALVDELAPLRDGAQEGHPWLQWAEASAHEQGQRLPGAVSRWNNKKDLSFELLRPELVVEVAYDQLQGDRFRHAGQLSRFRPDRDPRSCSYSQLETVVPAELAGVFGTSE